MPNNRLTVVGVTVRLISIQPAEILIKGGCGETEKRRTDVGSKGPDTPIHDFDESIQIFFDVRPSVELSEPDHCFGGLCDDGQDGLVYFGGVSFAHSIPDPAVALVSGHVPASGGFDGLIRDLA